MKMQERPVDKKKLRRENYMLRKRIKEMQGEFNIPNGLPQDIENKFLETVISFEEQSKKRKRIKVIDKLGRPSHFTPVDKIRDADIDQEWLKLYDFLYNNGIDLQVCSPNVSARELYRFTTQELFDIKINDISIPGMMTCFIYDEFYPDHKYENQQVAIESCIMYFLSKKEFNEFHFANTIRFNQYASINQTDLTELARKFRSQYDKSKDIHVDAAETVINNNRCTVSGTYRAAFIKAGEMQQKQGKWTVESCFDKKFRRWRVFNIQLEGVDTG